MLGTMTSAGNTAGDDAGCRSVFGDLQASREEDIKQMTMWLLDLMPFVGGVSYLSLIVMWL